MPPFIPVVSISRSQNIRLGRGPGLAKIKEINMSDTPFGLETGSLLGPFYADMGNPLVRRDFQRHSALGGLLAVAPVSNTNYTDLFTPSAPAVTTGSGFALSVAAFVLQSRFSGAQIAVPATTVTPVAPPSFGTRMDYVVVNTAGVVSVVQGGPDASAPTFQVLSLATSGTPTGGTFKLGFNYNGYWYQTGTIAYNASASTVATAVLAATGGPNNAALSAVVPGGTLVGSGGALPTAVVLTAGGALEGAFSNIEVLTTALTGGTNSAAAVTVTTPGVGAYGPVAGGSFLVLAPVSIPSTATSASNYTIGSTGLTLTS